MAPPGHTYRKDKLGYGSVHPSIFFIIVACTKHITNSVNTPSTKYEYSCVYTREFRCIVLLSWVTIVYKINGLSIVHGPANPRRAGPCGWWGSAPAILKARADCTQCPMQTASIDRQSCMRSSHAPRTVNPEPRVRANHKTESRNFDPRTRCQKTPSGGTSARGRATPGQIRRVKVPKLWAGN